MTYAPAWQQTNGDQAGEPRRIAASSLAMTARAINRQAESIGPRVPDPS